ncbi:hypothetical protein [Microtetraspora malaysiensis]|uniref:hypothetical protein n=1 Tax=Microtetraspora malaysiensis TaxID=161358 RepID=UPI00082F58EC|nr:hypothetical protein [Microtetraspora malaysiensis]
MRKVGALVVGGLLAVGMTALPSSAAAKQAPVGKVINTAGLASFEATTIGGSAADGDVYRIDFSKRPVRWYAYGAPIYPVCWIEGPKVTGPYGSTTAWISVAGAYSASGAGSQTVLTDAWVYTGNDIRKQIKKCERPEIDGQ